MRNFGMTVLSLLLSVTGAMAFSMDTGCFDGITETGHPRLFLKPGEEDAVMETVRKYPAVKRMHEAVIGWAEAALSQEPVTRQKEGKRLLAVSRESLKRVFSLSYAYRMTGDSRYAERAEKEMLACCAFSDWNPEHFLDVGEMALSMAIGYDWLYDVLSETTRGTVREAIVSKAFGPLESGSLAWFYEDTSNWNSVCNAGITAAALSIYEADPELCGSVIEASLASNGKALSVYAPDGGYPEGAMYWGYGSGFEIMLIDALESACGTDFGLADYPGFLQSGRFVQAMQTPAGGCFNYCDASYAAGCHPMLFWIAGRTDDPTLLYTETDAILSGLPFGDDRILPFAIVSASKAALDEISVPDWHCWFSRGMTPVFTCRSGWDSPDDTYFGIKGGTPSSSHAHMDGGSFIYEKYGVRWALDLGMQNYYSLEKTGMDIWDRSQDGDRWKVFRYRNMSHNTVSVRDSLHRVSGRAEIVDTFSSSSRKGAVLELTSLMPQFRKVTRTAILDDMDDLHIKDVFETGESSVTVAWVMNTEAEPEIVSDHEVRLACRGHGMTVSFRATSPFELKILSNDPGTEYDAPNPGTVRIVLLMEAGTSDTEVIETVIAEAGL